MIVGRRSVALFATLGLAGAPARAQERPGDAKLREELMALERQTWEYIRTRNRAGVRHSLADDAVLIFDDGTRLFKSEMLNDFMPNYRLDSYDIDPQYGLRTITPDVAVLLYRATSRGAERFDRTETTKVLASSLYARRDGKWWNVLYQETPIK